MNSKVFVVVVASLALAQAGLLAVRTVAVLQGPSSKTTIVGPDGSAISSVAPGGSVVTDGSGALTAPVALAAAPAVVVGGGAVGSITTSYTAAGPALLAAAPAVLGEGQYVADNTEQLHDDGSYKGE